MLFTIYKNGKIWDHVVIVTSSADTALKVYLKANMIEDHGEFTCDRGEREEESMWYDGNRRV